jgi:phospholipid-binding lipoprotein MlaA
VFASAKRLIALFIVAGTLIGCAASNQDPDDVNDPLESYNRVMFDINRTIDGVLLKPVAEFYVLIMPTWVQERVSNVLDNLGEPLNFANNLLQGKFERAGITVTRFALNSTLGVIGIFEVADEFGLERKPEDFGQTLASWGVGEGPFLMLPLLGPSNPRDAVGFAVDWVIDPMNYVLTDDARLGRTISRGIEQRSANLDNLEALEKTSIDFYAAMRELYRQFRANAIRDGALPPAMPIPSIDLDDDEELEE